MTKRTLDFIVIGAQKAGTTSLYEYLTRHPEIAMPSGKEAPYFSHNAIFARGWDAYLQTHFAQADGGKKWGTVTPHYMVGGVYDAVGDSAVRYDESTVPQRMAAQLPEVRLIAVLRDPVERAQSHHAMASLNGMEHRSFDMAVAELLEESALMRARAAPTETNGYVTWGEYARLLAPYAAAYPREQIRLLFTDALAADPEHFLRDTHQHIGVSEVVPENIGVIYRKRASERRLTRLTPESVQAKVSGTRAIRWAWHHLPPRGRAGTERTFMRLQYRFDLWNRRQASVSAPPSSETVARLREHFAVDGLRLRDQFEVDLPWMGTSV